MALRVLVVGVAWLPIDCRMRLKEAALAGMNVKPLAECETVDWQM